MKRLLWSWLPLGALALNGLTACGDASDGPSDGAAGANGQDNPCGPIDPSLGAADSAQLFGVDHVPAFDVYLPDDTWKNLQAHARDEQYVPAQACYDGKAIGKVGLRFKGSYGSLFNCFDASGNNTCRKLGMKLKFDEYAPEQRFFGLKRLNFQGYHYDNSYLKERLSYDLYRDMDITAPRASWAELRVNGESQGLFGMVEQIDGRFTKNRWPADGNGNLFKEVWPGRTDSSFIASRLETNEDAPDVSAFQAFSTALNAASSDELRATLGSYTDLDYFARYMAVDDAIANFDGITTYYTDGSPDLAGNHNFFLYQLGSRFVIIPWDLEATLSASSNFGAVPSWLTVPDDCRQTYYVWGGQNQVIAPGCDRVFQALNADLSSYREAAQRLLDGPMAEATLLPRIDTLEKFISAKAEADRHGPGAAEFHKAVGFLKQDIPRLRRRLEHLVSGEPSVPLQMDVGSALDFESADGYGILDGTTLMSNAHTTTEVTLERAAPIDGAQSLHFAFDFGNEEDSYQQWAFYQIPLASPPQDLTKLTGVRFKVRSNAARTLRVDVVSPRNSHANLGVQMGWEVEINDRTQVVSFDLTAAKIPSWAADPGDNLGDILRSAVGLAFKPACVGLVGGQLPTGVKDAGYIDLDDIEFY